MRATIKSIAEDCGLSPATVDRALHNRARVSAAARQRVLNSARQLGYLPEADATPLPARATHLEFLLPVGTNSFLAELAAHLESYAGSLPLVASCRIHRLDGPDPAHFLQAAENISSRTSGVGVVATDDPRTRELLKDLTKMGTRVVTIASDIPSIPRSAYVGVDNRAAGRVAGLLMGRLLRREPRDVAVFVGSHQYRGHEERDAGFRSILASEFPHLRISKAVEVFDTREESYFQTMELLDESTDIAGIYCVGGGRAGVVRALKERGLAGRVVVVCHDLTTESRKFLLNGGADVIIDQNAHLVAEQSVIALLGSIASAMPSLTRKFIEPRIILRENIPVD